MRVKRRPLFVTQAILAGKIRRLSELGRRGGSKKAKSEKDRLARLRVVELECEAIRRQAHEDICPVD